MTAAERCALCRGCRSIHACRARSSGILEVRPSLPDPAALSPRHRLARHLTAFAAIVGGISAIALPLLSVLGTQP